LPGLASFFMYFLKKIIKLFA